MPFRVAFTDRGWATYSEIEHYLAWQVGGTGNYQAARTFVLEFDRVVHDLELNALGFRISEKKELESRDLREISLRKQAYKIIYHVSGEMVFIDLVVHESQDYEKLL